MRYAVLLARTLPGADVEVLQELPARSEYLVTGAGGRALRVAFAEKADRTSFAVALASCLAKYAREVCMQAFNAHFGALQPGLRPTAGYVTDARRWLSEAGPALERAALGASDLVRER
jgi:ribonuclease HII